eukprot:4231759-Karenia_brevis.AAC.1
MDFYHDRPDRVEEMAAGIAAMPFTVLLSFQDNDFSNKIETHIRFAEPTFHAEPQLLRHPQKKVLRCITESPMCPPCALSDTSFEPGAGVALVPGGSAECFRALLEVADKPPAAEREKEDSPAVRVIRKVQCALRKAQDNTVYVVTQTGPINVVSRLLSPRRGERIHALVTWRSSGALTLLAYMPLPSEAAEVEAFAKFFSLEATLHKMLDTEEYEQATLTMAMDMTPMRKTEEALTAASAIATPEPWGKRARME